MTRRINKWPHSRFVNVGDRTRDEIFTLATELGCSESQIIRNALAEYLPSALLNSGITPYMLQSDRKDAHPGQWGSLDLNTALRETLERPRIQKRELPRLPEFPVTTRIKDAPVFAPEFEDVSPRLGE